MKYYIITTTNYTSCDILVTASKHYSILILDFKIYGISNCSLRIGYADNSRIHPLFQLDNPVTTFARSYSLVVFWLCSVLHIHSTVLACNEH